MPGGELPDPEPPTLKENLDILLHINLHNIYFICIFMFIIFAKQKHNAYWPPGKILLSTKDTAILC